MAFTGEDMIVGFTEPGLMTSGGKYADRLAALPADVASLAAVAQGLLIHEFLVGQYGVTLADEDRWTVHLRPVERILEAIVERDDRPLDVPREPAGRTASNCRGFTVLMVAMLRAKGVPARSRCGFGTYFTDGWFEDHWVAEYWRAEDQRWVRADAQIDGVQRQLFGMEFDPLDLPAGAFLTGGEAWQLIRAGKADPDRFGLSSIPESGDWWIAGNLMRDVAAMAGVETLPWDVWGSMPEPGAPVDIELFDRMAAGQAPVTVPEQVFSVLRKRLEPLTS
jgi:hypothetical protein